MSVPILGTLAFALLVAAPLAASTKIVDVGPPGDLLSARKRPDLSSLRSGGSLPALLEPPMPARVDAVEVIARTTSQYA